jgi:hypothetical protein
MNNLIGLRLFSRSTNSPPPPAVEYPVPASDSENARYVVDIMIDAREVRRFEIETVSRAHALWRATMYAVSMGFWNVAAVEFVSEDIDPDATIGDGLRALPH